MKKLSLILLLMLFLLPSKAYGQEVDKFGIHVLGESDFADAAEILNKNDETWSFVTLVIREDERDIARWQSAFNDLKSKKLIPIVRLATTMDERVWTKPTEGEAKPWAKFLYSLNWPTGEKTVILFNEPNHTKEWGGDINPGEYAQIARAYWEQFKRYDENFIILPAALDAAAPNSRNTMDSFQFFQKMADEDSLVFTLFDGINSHSYPNPGFIGHPSDIGKASIKGFESEISFLENYHIRANLPIYITETGWKSTSFQPETIKNYYKFAFEGAWNHPNIKTVTPFVINYSQYPFADFSWKNTNGAITNYFEKAQENI